MPFWTLYPNGPLRDNVVTNAWIPMDDDHTMVFNITWKKRTPPLAMMKDGKAITGLGRSPQTLPNSTDWFGRWRLTTNAQNDYQIDREVQRTQSFSGITGVTQQDMAMTESMGAIVDRTIEHLAPTDRMITMTRRRLLKAARAFARPISYRLWWTIRRPCAGRDQVICSHLKVSPGRMSTRRPADRCSIRWNRYAPQSNKPAGWTG